MNHPRLGAFVLARDADRTVLPILIIGAALVIAGIASQYAVGRLMHDEGARVLLFLLGGSGAVLVVVSLLLAGFLRDPERAPGGPGLLSPADGKVVLVDEKTDPDVGPAHRIAIFMSPLDVHVNRVPAAAKLMAVEHHPGGYVPAFRKESEQNERLSTLWRATGDAEDGLPAGTPFRLVQIAGALAKRIVCWQRPDAHLGRGDRYGIIKLGSRVDLYVPRDVQSAVRVGDRVKAGQSVIAHAPAPGPVKHTGAERKPEPPVALGV